jgi:predicted N-acetyltransferase YhbS
MTAGLLIQQIRPIDEDQFSELLDRCFQLSKGQHYLDDFPVWRGQQPEILKMGAYDGERLIGTAAVRIADVHGTLQTFSAGLIGAVATDEKYRGRGIAKKLVALATDWAANRGAALAALWGSEHALYAKIGFFPGGIQMRVPLSSFHVSGNASGNQASSTETFHTGWNPAIFRLLQQRKQGVSFSEIDRLWFSSHKNVKWFWCGPKERPLAYAALGRGIDLPHMVHEWGGQHSALLPLLREVLRIDSAAELLGSPETFSQIGVQFDPSHLEYLCLANLLDPVRLFRAFVGKETVQDFSAQFINDHYVIRCQAVTEKSSAEISVSRRELAELFLGPRSAASLGLQAPWSEIFPIPLWFWGLDAV